jgi:hypothetical protein
MAKLNEEKVLEQISDLEIDEQVTFYYKVKETVTANLDAHQKELESQSNTYQSIKEKINGN